MRDDSLMTADAPDLVERCVYPLSRRVKRGVLRGLGRWSRGRYDVRVIYAENRPIFKKVVFNSAIEAREIADAIGAFGPSVHVPDIHQQRDSAVWVDYVAGRRFDPLDAEHRAAASECFTVFARRPSEQVSVEASAYPQRCRTRLEWLRHQQVIDTDLAEALHVILADTARGQSLRIGFDYADPIAANLLIRSDTGDACAIDIKNIRQNAPIGLGLAKARARWLDDDGLACMFERLEREGLNDVVAAFPFIRVFERIERVAGQARIEQRSRGRIRKRADKTAKLAALTD